MMSPPAPEEEGVERREQHAHAHALAQREEIVPQPHHRGHEATSGPFDVAMLLLPVLEHQAKHGHAAVAQPVQMIVDASQVAATEQPRELRPGDRLVGADRSPRLARLELEVGRVGAHHPGQIGAHEW